MTPLIRRATDKDALGIHQAHMNSILEVCAKDHNEAQLTAWGRRDFNESIRLRGIRDDKVWVVEIDGTIEGFAHISFAVRDHENVGHLWGLYITSKVLRQGVGRKLFERVCEDARAAGISRFDFSSTVTSHHFYQKMGCRDLPGPGFHRLSASGVELPAFQMEFWIGNAPPRLRLEKPSIKYLDDFVKAMKIYKTEGLYEEFDLEAFIKNPEPQFQEWADKETHPRAGKVPDLYLWAIENDKYVGRISLRLELNEFLKKIGGHVGYETAPAARSRGIAKEMLRLLKMYPQAKKIRSLLITCDEHNLASQKVMTSNGAVRVPNLVWYEIEKRNLKHFLLNTTIYPQIQTERLILDRVVQDDANNIFEFASDQRVAEFVTWEAHKTIEDSHQFLSYIAQHSIESEQKSFYVFAIRRNGDQKMIGSLQFSRSGIVGQVDYALHCHHWNQ